MELPLFLEQYELKLNSLSVSLNPEQIKFIRQFISTSPSFEKINKELQQIIENQTIDIHDLPQIILLISNIIYIEYTQTDSQDKELLIQIIRLTIDVVVESGIFPFGTIEKKITEKIVDYSIQLLFYNIHTGKEETKKPCFALCTIS